MGTGYFTEHISFESMPKPCLDYKLTLYSHPPESIGAWKSEIGYLYGYENTEDHTTTPAG